MANESGEVDIRDFAAVLMDLPGAHNEASVKLNELVAAVRETRKAGKLTLTFAVSTGKLDDTMIEILPDVKVAIPRQPLRGAVFFPDDNNNPTKDDPSQLWRGDDIRAAPTFQSTDTDVTIKGAPTE